MGHMLAGERRGRRGRRPRALAGRPRPGPVPPVREVGRPGLFPRRPAPNPDVSHHAWDRRRHRLADGIGERLGPRRGGREVQGGPDTGKVVPPPKQVTSPADPGPLDPGHEFSVSQVMFSPQSTKWTSGRERRRPLRRPGSWPGPCPCGSGPRGRQGDCVGGSPFPPKGRPGRGSGRYTPRSNPLGMTTILPSS